MTIKEKWASLFIPKKTPYCHHRFKNEIKKQDLKEENERLKKQMKQAVELLYLWGETLSPEFQKKMLQILENGDSNE